MIRKNVVCLALALLAATILFTALSFAGKPQKTESLRTVSLDVTIEDSGTAIYSDGQGAYSDGVNILSAALNSAGNLVVFFGQPSQHGKPQSPPEERAVCFDFSDFLNLDCPISSCGWETPFETGCVSGSDLATRPVSDPDAIYTPLQNLGQGDSEIVELYWTLHFNDNTLNWRINFHSGLADYGDSPSAYAIVTCTDKNSSSQCIEWTVEPDPVSLPVALLVKGELVRNSSTQTPEGFFNMPFKLTLTAK